MKYAYPLLLCALVPTAIFCAKDTWFSKTPLDIEKDKEVIRYYLFIDSSVPGGNIGGMITTLLDYVGPKPSSPLLDYEDRSLPEIATSIQTVCQEYLAFNFKNKSLLKQHQKTLIDAMKKIDNHASKEYLLNELLLTIVEDLLVLEKITKRLQGKGVETSGEDVFFDT